MFSSDLWVVFMRLSYGSMNFEPYLIYIMLVYGVLELKQF